MKADAFGELLKSVRQAGNIRRGALKPSRVTKVKPSDIKAVRASLGQSQVELSVSRRGRTGDSKRTIWL